MTDKKTKTITDRVISAAIQLVDTNSVKSCAEYDELVAALSEYQDMQTKYDNKSELDKLMTQWNSLRPQPEINLDFGGYSLDGQCPYCTGKGG